MLQCRRGRQNPKAESLEIRAAATAQQRGEKKSEERSSKSYRAGKMGLNFRSGKSLGRMLRNKPLTRCWEGSHSHPMDKVTRYEWHGSALLLVLLCFLGITIPFAVVYFTTNLLRIETQVPDGTKLSEFLQARK